MIALECLISSCAEGIRRGFSNAHREHAGVHRAEPVDTPGQVELSGVRYPGAPGCATSRTTSATIAPRLSCTT